MAITKGAKKAHRQSLRKHAVNQKRRTALRSALKDVRLSAQAGRATESLPAGRQGDTKALAAAYQAIDKALKRGIIKKNTAARRKAKVAKALSVKK